MTTATILFADDDDQFRRTMKQSLTRAGYKVIVARNPEEARNALRTQKIDVAVLDLHLDPNEGLDEWSGLQIAREEGLGVPKILLTSDDNALLKAIAADLRALKTVPLFRTDGVHLLIGEIKRALVPTVFLAHGPNQATTDMVARAIEKLELAVMLLEEKGAGDYLLENLETYAARVQAAVILLTPDDEGRLRSEQSLERRARQNVILELGFFIATCGRQRVIALHDADVVAPSIYKGIHTIDFDAAGAWREKLSNALEDVLKHDKNTR